MKIDVFAAREVEGQAEPDLEPLVTFSLPELDTIATNEVATKEGSTKPKVSLNFELSRSHLFKLKSATVTMDEKIIEEVIPEKKVEEKEEKEKEGSDESGDEGSNEEGTEETEKSEEATEESENKEESEDKEEEPVEKEYRERIETHSYTLEIDETLHGVRLLNKDQIKEARKRLVNLEKRDDDKKLTDEAKN